MKVLTLGNGFIADHLPYEKFTGHLPIDNGLTFEEWVVDKYQPDVVINCIGRTGRPNIDWCESHKEETTLINTALPIVLAEACSKHSIRMIHLGSGCIYFGESPNYHYVQGDGSPMPDIKTYSLGDPNYQPFWGRAYTLVMPSIRIEDGWKETDFANPKSFYSKTKYACDLVLSEMSNVTTLRIRMPVSERDNPRNLINKLRGYNKVINLPNSMTFMSDLTRCVDWAVKNDTSGIFHVANPQPLTAVAIMKEFQKYVPEHQFEQLWTEEQLDQLTVAKRSNCILNTDKLRAAGFTMTNSQEALSECMARYVKNIRRM